MTKPNEPTPGPWTWTGDEANYLHTHNNWLRGPKEGVLMHGGPWPVSDTNAALIADAPAMALVLEMVELDIVEFNLRRKQWDFWGGSADGWSFYDKAKHPTYTDLVNAIGWDRCRAAVAAAKGVRDDA